MPKAQLKQLKGVAPNIVIAFIVIGIVLLTKPSYLQLFGILLGVQFLIYGYKFVRHNIKPSVRQIIISVLQLVAILTFIYFINYYSGLTGLTAFMVICFAFAGFMLWRRWSLYIEGIRSIETQIFGKPQDRKLWKKGEKPTWRKTKNSKQKK